MNDTLTAPAAIETSKFSFYYAPISNIKPFKDVSLSDIHRAIIHPLKYKTVTDELRAGNKSIKSQKMDYVTFSCIGKERKNEAVISHSGLICVDLDHVGSIDAINELKNKIQGYFTPALMFTSPSGDGLKVVFKININDASHLDFYHALESFFKQEFNLQIDKACKDIVRACFLCHDADAVYNSQPDTLDKSFIDTFQKQPEFKPENQLSDFDIMERCKTWLNAKETFIQGNRNHYVTLLAGAYNRFGINEFIAINDLAGYSQTDFTAKEIESIVKSVYSNRSWHNTAKFDENKPYIFDKVEQTTITPALPIDGLPDYLQDIINLYTQIYITPRDFIAASIIQAIAFACGAKIELQGKYKNAALLWLAIVGDVSSGKTHALNFAFNPFNDADTASIKAFDELMEAYQVEQSKPKNEREPIDKPECKQYILNDYTPESLVAAHTVNPQLMIFRDELKGWFDDFNRYAKNGEQSNMLSSFYRQPMTYNRKGSGTLKIGKPFISVSGGIQPDLLPSLASDQRAENGFLSRFCFVYPDNQLKPKYSNDFIPEAVIQAYSEIINLILNLPQINLTLTPEAANLYEFWFNENAEKSNNETSGYLKGVYGKLDVIALRLAIVFHVANNLYADEFKTDIEAKTMQSALDVTEYFRATALKVYRKIFTDTHSDLDKKAVIKYCHSLGASQNEIAAAIKTSQQYVGKILNNKT